MSNRVDKPIIDSAIAEPGAMSRAQDETLAHITRTIVEGVHPRRIVLFGSRARGEGDDISDYDIMVEMETDQRPLERATAIDRLFDYRDCSLPDMDLLVFTPEEFVRWKDQVGMIHYNIEREGRVLYVRDDANGDHLPAPAAVAGPQRVREPGPERPDRAVAEMLASKAERDLLTIEKCLAPGLIPWDTVCFHAQQAAEKYLKALLVSRGVNPLHTHNLSKLLGACTRSGAEVSALHADCAMLTRYAVGPRYADEPRQIEEAEGRAAVAAAHRVRAAIRPLLDSPGET